MTQVDASIPLSVKPMQLDSPMQAYGQMMNLQSLQASTKLQEMEVEQGMQTLKDQSELSQLGMDPANLDPKTGGFNTAAMAKITNPMLRQKLTQGRMQQLKESADIDWKTSETKLHADKAKSDALHGVMEEAYSTYEDVRTRTGNEPAARDAFNKALTGGYDDIKTSGRGGFPKDTQFKMLTPEEVGPKLISHKERMDMETKKKAAERGEETPIIKETRYVEKLKGELADLAPGDPAAKSIAKQIADVQAHIVRLDRAAAVAGEKAPAGYEWDPAKPGALRPIAGGPAAKDKRDVLQADALSAYRAAYPYGYMPEQYGKTQPRPEKYVEEYIKNKEAGGKSMPKDVKGDAPKVGNKAEFDKLKKGTTFIDTRDGKEKVKG